MGSRRTDKGRLGIPPDGGRGRGFREPGTGPRSGTDDCDGLRTKKRLRIPPGRGGRGRGVRGPGTGPRAAKGQCIGLNKVNEVLDDAVAEISERVFPNGFEEDE